MKKPERIEFETFMPPNCYHVESLRKEDTMSCFNDIVMARRYRVIIEEIPEGIAVIQARLQKMYEETNNIHHMRAIRAEADRLGIKLGTKQ